MGRVARSPYDRLETALAFQVIFDVVWPLNDDVNVPAKSDVAEKPTRCVSLIGPPSVVVAMAIVGVGVASSYQLPVLGRHCG